MRGAAFLLSAAIGAPVIVALVLPSNLFGSAPGTREWRADTPEIRIVDGETLGLGDRVVRLYGMAAPMRGEACQGARGESFDCGGASAAALMRLVGSRPISCRIVGQDGFGRGIGQCEAAGTDLARALVTDGFAVATGSALRAAEVSARQASRGLWSNRAGAPQDWRARE